MQIPPSVVANNQGLIGVKVRLEEPVGQAVVPVGFARYEDLDPQELAIHLCNRLVMMGIDGSIVGKHDVVQMDDAA